jgi:hypothetical protein
VFTKTVIYLLRSAATTTAQNVTLNLQPTKSRIYVRAWDSDGAAPDSDNEGTRATDKANQRKSAVGSTLEKADDVEAESRGAKI